MTDTAPATDDSIWLDVPHHLSTLRRLTDVVVLAAKGLRRDLAEGSACETDGAALVEFAWLLSAEVHALRSLVTGEPAEITPDLAGVKVAVRQARIETAECAR